MENERNKIEEGIETKQIGFKTQQNKVAQGIHCWFRS